MRTAVCIALVVCGTALLATPMIYAAVAVAQTAVVLAMRPQVEPTFRLESRLPSAVFATVVGAGGGMVLVGIIAGLSQRRPAGARMT